MGLERAKPGEQTHAEHLDSVEARTRRVRSGELRRELVAHPERAHRIVGELRRLRGEHRTATSLVRALGPDAAAHVEREAREILRMEHLASVAARRVVVGAHGHVSRPRPRAASRSRSRRSRPARRPSGARAGPPGDSEGGGDGDPPPAATRRQRSSNSQSADTVCPCWEPGDHGIDTVTFGWYDAEAVEALLAAARSDDVDPDTGRRRQRWSWSGRALHLEQLVAGIHFAAYPANSLVTAEARLVVMLTGDRDDHTLARPDSLLAGLEAAEAALATLGLSTTGHAHVRRVDLAAELRFRDGADGLRFLGACERGLRVPRLKQVAHRLPGHRLESLAWQTPARSLIRLRLYDAGVRHNTDLSGRRLRLERQERWQGQKVRPTAALSVGELARLFRAPLAPVLRHERSVTVTAPSEAVSLLYAKARTGEITRRRAEALSGKISTLAVADDLLSQHDRRLRLRELERAGVALDLARASTTTIDITSPLRALVRAYGGSIDDLSAGSGGQAQ